MGSQEYRRILNYVFLSYLICSQISLHHLIMDDHHFSYITKLKTKKKKKPLMLHLVLVNVSSMNQWSKVIDATCELVAS